MPSEDTEKSEFNQYLKVSKHFPSGFLISVTSSFRSIENKHYVYRSNYCLKKFCESLREHAVKIIN